MPSYLSHGDTYVRFMVFASSESSQIGILMAALLKTDTNRLSYEASHKAKEISLICSKMLMSIVITIVVFNEHLKRYRNTQNTKFIYYIKLIFN